MLHQWIYLIDFIVCVTIGYSEPFKYPPPPRAVDVRSLN